MSYIEYRDIELTRSRVSLVKCISGYVKHFLILLSILFVVSCSDREREAARLASGCINASPDNRVKLSGSWSNTFEVEEEGNDIIVRTEVPVGIALTGRIKFVRREFRCRKVGDRIEFVSAAWEQPAR